MTARESPMIGNHTPDTDGTNHCRFCGAPVGASGCDGGSWVHLNTRPDRPVLSLYSHGVWLETRLANGVILRPKRGTR